MDPKKRRFESDPNPKRSQLKLELPNLDFTTLSKTGFSPEQFGKELELWANFCLLDASGFIIAMQKVVQTFFATVHDERERLVDHVFAAFLVHRPEFLSLSLRPLIEAVATNCIAYHRQHEPFCRIELMLFSNHSRKFWPTSLENVQLEFLSQLNSANHEFGSLFSRWTMDCLLAMSSEERKDLLINFVSLVLQRSQRASEDILGLFQHEDPNHCFLTQIVVPILLKENYPLDIYSCLLARYFSSPDSSTTEPAIQQLLNSKMNGHLSADQLLFSKSVCLQNIVKVLRILLVQLDSDPNWFFLHFMHPLCRQFSQPGEYLLELLFSDPSYHSLLLFGKQNGSMNSFVHIWTHTLTLKLQNKILRIWQQAWTNVAVISWPVFADLISIYDQWTPPLQLFFDQIFPKLMCEIFLNKQNFLPMICDFFFLEAPQQPCLAKYLFVFLGLAHHVSQSGLIEIQLRVVEAIQQSLSALFASSHPERGLSLLSLFLHDHSEESELILKALVQNHALSSLRCCLLLKNPSVLEPTLQIYLFLLENFSSQLKPFVDRELVGSLGLLFGRKNGKSLQKLISQVLSGFFVLDISIASNFCLFLWNQLLLANDVDDQEKFCQQLVRLFISHPSLLEILIKKAICKIEQFSSSSEAILRLALAFLNSSLRFEPKLQSFFHMASRSNFFSQSSSLLQIQSQFLIRFSSCTQIK